MAEKLDYVLALLNRPEGQIKKCRDCVDCNNPHCPQLYDDDDIDYCNDNLTRNCQNMEYPEYNCGGFALNTFNWFVPRYYALNLDQYRNITESTVNTMINMFQGDLRIIHSLNEIAEDEYPLMFRFEFTNNISNISHECCDGCDQIDKGCGDCEALDGEDLDWYLGDFHFIREFNGRWLHKPGSSEVREIPVDKIFQPWDSDGWDERYCGDIIIMAMKKSRDLLLNI